MYDTINKYLNTFIEENLDKKTDTFEIIEIDAKPDPDENNSRELEMTVEFVVEVRRKDTKPIVKQIEDAILALPEIELDGTEIEQDYQGTRTYLFASTWNRQIKIKYKYSRTRGAS